MLEIYNDKVVFTTSYKKFYGTIYQLEWGWFLSINNSPNDAILLTLGYNTLKLKKDLYQNVLGYWIKTPHEEAGGICPYCKTRQDLIYLLWYLDDLITKKDKDFLDLENIWLCLKD